MKNTSVKLVDYNLYTDTLYYYSTILYALIKNLNVEKTY